MTRYDPTRIPLPTRSPSSRYRTSRIITAGPETESNPYEGVDGFLANFVADDIEGVDDTSLTGWAGRYNAYALESGTGCTLKTTEGPTGGKAVRYTGSMAAPSEMRSAFVSANAATVFAVIRTSDESPKGFLRTGTTGGGTDPHWPFGGDDLYTEFFSNSRSPGIATAVDLTSYHVAAIRRTTGNNVSVWVNGTQEWVGGLGAMSARSTLLMLYASEGTYDIAEMVCFASAVPNVGMGEVYDVLAARYSL